MINGRRWELWDRDREHAAPASRCQSLGMQLVRPNGNHIPLQRWHLKPLPCYPAVDTAGLPLPSASPRHPALNPRYCICQTPVRQMIINRQSFCSNKCGIINNVLAGCAHGGQYWSSLHYALQSAHYWSFSIVGIKQMQYELHNSLDS